MAFPPKKSAGSKDTPPAMKNLPMIPMKGKNSKPKVGTGSKACSKCGKSNCSHM